MIFIGFLLISAIFFVSAHFAGGIKYFFNIDSLFIPLVVVLIFSIFTFNFGNFLKGIKTMFMFSKNGFKADAAVAKLYKTLIFVTLAAGLCSTFQGLITGILADWYHGVEMFPIRTILCFASFTTVYGLMYATFLFYPIYLLHKGNE
jgi:hypothetical protein